MARGMRGEGGAASERRACGEERRVRHWYQVCSGLVAECTLNKRVHRTVVGT